MSIKTFPNLPYSLQLKIKVVQSEDDAYAADELVELGEEILAYLAVMRSATYLIKKYNYLSIIKHCC
jgi:hypothetical protein